MQRERAFSPFFSLSLFYFFLFFVFVLFCFFFFYFGVKRQRKGLIFYFGRISASRSCFYLSLDFFFFILFSTKGSLFLGFVEITRNVDPSSLNFAVMKFSMISNQSTSSLVPVVVRKHSGTWKLGGRYVREELRLSGVRRSFSRACPFGVWQSRTRSCLLLREYSFLKVLQLFESVSFSRTPQIRTKGRIFAVLYRELSCTSTKLALTFGDISLRDV